MYKYISALIVLGMVAGAWALDATKPTDLELVNTHARYLRETRDYANQLAAPSTNAFKTYTSTRRLTVQSFGAYTSAKKAQFKAYTSGGRATLAQLATKATLANTNTFTGFNNFSTQGLRAARIIGPNDIRYYMDGKSGRPTRAYWESNQTTTDLTSTVSYARGLTRELLFPSATYRGNFTFDTYMSVKGSAVGTTKFIPHNGTDDVVKIVQGTTPYPYIQGLGGSFSDITVDCGLDHDPADPGISINAFTTQNAFRLYGGSASGEPNSSVGQYSIEHNQFTACGGHGIYLDGTGIDGTASIFAQVAWVTIAKNAITWNKGNGIRIAGVAHQTHITDTNLIDSNCRGCAKPASEDVINERAQILIKNEGGAVGFPAKHVIDGATTIQSGDYTWATLNGSMAAGVSVYSGQGVSIRDNYFESNDIGICSNSTITDGLVVTGNRIKDSDTYGVLLAKGINTTIRDNQFEQSSVGGTGIKANPTSSSSVSKLTIEDNSFSNFSTNTNVSTDLVGVKNQERGSFAKPGTTYGTTSGTITVDLSKHKYAFVELNNDVTITLANPVVGEEYTISVDRLTAAHTVTWADTIKWDGGTPPAVPGTNYHSFIVKLLYRTNGAFYEIGRTSNVKID